MFESVLQLTRTYRHELWLGGLVSVALMVACAILVPIVIIRLPSDYFTEAKLHVKPQPSSVFARLGTVLRAVLGAILIFLGAVMLLVPGQGLLTMLIGVMLIDFPGKKRLERKLIQQPVVLTLVNTVREKAGKDPLRL